MANINQHVPASRNANNLEAASGPEGLFNRDCPLAAETALVGAYPAHDSHAGRAPARAPYPNGQSGFNADGLPECCTTLLHPCPRRFSGEPPIKIDLSESEHGYIAQAEIRLVKKDEIIVVVDTNWVSISIDKKTGTAGWYGEKILCRDCYSGTCSCGISLGHAIDTAQSRAELDGCRLTLKLPKRAQPELM